MTPVFGLDYPRTALYTLRCAAMLKRMYFTVREARFQYIKMQRVLILARRLPVLSSLRPKSARYAEQLQQMRPAGSLFRPLVQANHAHELRAFHASSSALAKHLNFNLADIGEGIAEVCARSFLLKIVGIRMNVSLHIRLSCFSGLLPKANP